MARPPKATGPSPNHPPGSPHSEGALSMREMILIKAKELFRQRGFASVSISDIVDAVGVTKPTLYHYFEDKQDLFAQVLIQMLKNGQAFLTRGIEEVEGFENQIQALAYGYFRYSPTSISALTRDALEHLEPPHQRAFLEAFDTCVLLPVVGFFQRALADDLLKSQDPVMMARLFVSMLDTINVQRALYQLVEEQDLHKLAGDCSRIFLNGVMKQPA